MEYNISVKQKNDVTVLEFVCFACLLFAIFIQDYVIWKFPIKLFEPLLGLFCITFWSISINELFSST